MCYEFLFFLSHYGSEAIILGSGEHRRVMQKEGNVLAEHCKWAPDTREREGSRDFLSIPLSNAGCPGSGCSREYRED